MVQKSVWIDVLSSSLSDADIVRGWPNIDHMLDQCLLIAKQFALIGIGWRGHSASTVHQLVQYISTVIHRTWKLWMALSTIVCIFTILCWFGLTAIQWLWYFFIIILPLISTKKKTIRHVVTFGMIYLIIVRLPVYQVILKTVPLFRSSILFTKWLARRHTGVLDNRLVRRHTGVQVYSINI